MSEVQLPEAVRKAKERSDALIAESQKIIETPAGDQDQATDGKTVEHGQEPTQPAAAKTSVENDESFKQKYSVLQGKYNAEVPRLNAKVRDLTDENSRLAEENARLKADLAAAGTKKQPSATTPQDDDELDLREFGFDDGDQDDPIYKTAVKVNKLNSGLKQISETVNQIKETVGSVEQERVKSAKERFEEELKTLVGPDFDAINEDPEFSNWLKNDVDPATSRPRWNWFVEAYQGQDSPRLAVFFNMFRDIRAHQASAARSNSNVPKTPPNVQPAPKRAEAPRNPNQGDRIWTRQDITAFYTAVTKGEYRGRPDEKQAIEQDIFRAQQEGRIR